MPLVLGGAPFDRRLARAHGVGPKRLRTLLARGEIRHVLNDVYVDSAVPEDLELRARCLRLRLPDGAALSRRTAAWLLGVDIRPIGEQTLPLQVECTVPPGREPLSRPGVRCYVAPLDETDVVVVDDVRCTSPARTAVDVLRWSRPHEGLALVDAMAARDLVDAATLPVCVERFAGGRGVVRARRLAALVEPLTESPGESWLRLRLIDAGFPRPQAQIQVGPYRLDLGWPDRRIAIEYDGEEFHEAPRQRRHDELRREDLQRRFGWTAIGVGKGDVLGPSPALELAVGELLSLEPRSRRRLW